MKVSLENRAQNFIARPRGGVIHSVSLSMLKRRNKSIRRRGGFSVESKRTLCPRNRIESRVKINCSVVSKAEFGR